MSTSRDNVLEELQRLREEHLLKAREIGVQINSMAPISRLPVEIICRIFQFHALEYSDTSNPYEWVYVSHVCARWRNIALDCPPLWRHVILTKHFACTDAAILRSKNSLLHVKADQSLSSPASVVSSLQGIFREFSRVRSLDIRLQSSVFRNIINQMHLADYSHLRYLRLSSFSSKEVPGYTMMLLPKSADIGLETINLHMYRFEWPSLARCLALKHLHIVHESALVLAPPDMTLTNMLDALKAMPLLETLELKNEIPAVDLTVKYSVVLPRLTQLTLSGIPSECAAFLDHLSFPSTANVWINDLDWYVREVVEDQEMEFAHSVLRQVVRSNKDESDAFPSFALTSQGDEWDDRVFDLRGWSTERDIEISRDELNATPPKMWLELQDTEVLVGHVLANLPLSKVQTLWISPFTFHHLLAIPTFFASFTSVTALHLFDCHAELLYPLLEWKLLTTTASAFPRLQNLLLSRIKFYSCPSPMHNHELGCISILHEILLERIALGRKLQRLSFSECIGLRRNQLEDLRQAVEELDWDNKEQVW